eukprot:CAMPEP_0194343942 /NCGR_PEP_ID=MMETSP0171-20130528/99308_1 /TAXON_ID=218684 /ORGANISM="Corethron pennatum, Strain L29A3" /LENGTH=66 /DNA_ID=CAMNT_0039110403 /DNA_START=77 /DNA_END=274 /DNA_ORIENTATION=+
MFGSAGAAGRLEAGARPPPPPPPSPPTSSLDRVTFPTLAAMMATSISVEEMSSRDDAQGVRSSSNI